jgi:hypothetical protein
MNLKDMKGFVQKFGCLEKEKSKIPFKPIFQIEIEKEDEED